MDTNLVASDLLCEYKINPIGIDTCKPRFSWRVNTEIRGQSQSAYQILVSSTLEDIKNDKGDMLDTGKVESSQNTNVEYSGKRLESGKCYYWKVRIWDRYGNISPYSEIASFEMGLLSLEDWEGEWLTSPSVQLGRSPLFRKEFIVDKPVKKARAYISGLGYYELRVNGKKVGDYVLDPGWTVYKKRVFYTTYRIEDFLNEGINVIGIILGNGWWGNSYQGFRNRPQVILQINIEYVDGDTVRVITSKDSGWLVSDGPILENNIYHGEVYDARLEKLGWDTPEYSKKNREELNTDWKDPLLADLPGGVMVSQIIEPIKVVREIKPVGVNNPKPNIYVYDLGQNIAGWVRIKVDGQWGDEVKIKYAEILYDDGTVNQENLVGARATDVYILRGDGVETYEPRFTYHGFRYIQIELSSSSMAVEDVVGRVVRSSVECIGDFSCSNELLNQIHRNVVWTESNNLHSVPTDCPQRSERMGWLNDMTVRCEEALYNFNLANFYFKWLKDIKDEQGEETGAITDTAPYVYGNRPADPVSCYLVVAYSVYTHYDDKRILEEYYESMKKWVNYLVRQSRDYILSYSYFGDWASPIGYSITESIGSGAVSSITPGELISTGYLYYNVKLLSKIAHILQRYSDEKDYKELGEKIKEAFNSKFLDCDRNQYATGSQASNIFPLFLDVVPEENKKQIINNIIRDVLEVHKGHLSTGNQCTKYLLEVLTALGFVDVAYTIATQTTYPSWGYMIKHGATTIWERWEIMTGSGMNSYDHPMNGAIGAWFYKCLAGIIPTEDNPGFGKFIIKPSIPKDLKWVRCSLKTIKGTIVSNWERKDDAFLLEIQVPFNTMAKVYIPKLQFRDKNLKIEEGTKKIFEDHQLLTRENWIMDCKEENEYIILTVGSGSYLFTVRVSE